MTEDELREAHAAFYRLPIEEQEAWFALREQAIAKAEWFRERRLSGDPVNPDRI